MGDGFRISQAFVEVKADDQTEDGSKKIGGKLVAGLGALGLGAVIAKSVSDGLDIQAGQAKLNAQLGLTKAQAGVVGSAAGKLFSNGYGTGMDQINEATGSVIKNIDGMRGASSAALQDVAGKALNTSNIFDQDLGGVTAAVGQLMKTGLAKNADDAFDIITKGLQGGANKADDFLDTLNEYGTQFRKMGIDGATATGIIQQGLQGGARDGDLVADAIKEFSIRAVDGSATTAAGFKALGLSGKTMGEQIGKGGKGAEAGLATTLDKLRAIKDPVKQAAAATQLFGTQSEDLGKALYAIHPETAAAGLGKVKGAADDAGKAFNDNAKSNIGTFFRTLQMGATNVIGGVFIPAISQAATWVGNNLTPVLQEGSDFVSHTLTPAFASIGTTLVSDVLPILGMMMGFFIGQVVPVLRTVTTYVATSLVPVFLQIVQVIRAQVIPILASLAGWFITKILPAILQIYEHVAQNLKPVFDQLVATFRTQVLPTLQQLLVKFEQWRPTLQHVVEIILKVVGIALELSAKLLAVLLPVLIRVAGWILANLVPAIASIVTVIIRVIGWVANLVGAFARIGSGIGSAASAVGSAIGRIGGFFSGAYNTVTGWVSKIVGAVQGIPDDIAGLAGDMASAGGKMIGGLWNGLKSVFGGGMDIAKDIEGAINNVLGLPKSIGGWGFSALGHHVSLPTFTIPAFAAGGVVPATNGGRLGVFGEAGQDEAIAPLGTLNKMLAQAVKDNVPAWAPSGPGVHIDNLTIEVKADDLHKAADVLEMITDAVSKVGTGTNREAL